MVNMLKTLMENVDNMQKMGNVGRETEIPRENQIEMLELKSTVTEIKNPFDSLINRGNRAMGESLRWRSRDDNRDFQTSKTEKQRKKPEKNPEQNVQELCDITNGVIYTH